MVKILCSVYVSPEGSPIYTEETGIDGIEIFEEKLLKVVQNYLNACYMLAGDSNARCWEFQDILPNDKIGFILGDNNVYEADEFNLPRNTEAYLVMLAFLS